MNWSEKIYREMEEEILLFIYQYRLFTGQAPAQREMAEALAITRYRVRRLLERLSEKQLIERAAGVPRGISLTEGGRAQASRRNQVQALLVGGEPFEELVADAYLPEEVHVGHAFRVRVLVRPTQHPAEIPRRREKVETERVHIIWPADEKVELAIAIRAADCRIDGSHRRYVQMRRGHATVPVSFQLIPLHEGEILIDVDILQRHDDVVYGSIAAWTMARPVPAGTLRLRTHSSTLNRPDYTRTGPLGDAQRQYTLLRALLLNCGPFDTDAELKALFVDPRLQAWRNIVPDAADNRSARVSLLLDRLHRRTHSETGQNALILLLNAVADQIPPDDLCHDQLRQMADRLGRLLSDTGRQSPFAPLISGEPPAESGALPA